jgi:hypothetical protein
MLGCARLRRGAAECAAGVPIANLAWFQRPECRTGANFTTRFRVEGTRRSKPRPLVTELPMVVRLIEKADRWQRELASGLVSSRAELARREKTSTGRVSQVLRLLDLPEPLLAAIRQLPPGTPARLVTERMLRRGVSPARVSGVVRACQKAAGGSAGKRH